MDNLYRFRGYILGLLAGLLLVLPGIGFPSRQTLGQSADSLQYFMLWFPFILSETLLLLSILLRIQARRSIGEHTRGRKHDADQVVTWGVYSKIRHPLYLSNTGVGVSFVLFHLGFSWETLLFVFVLVVYERLLAKMEDRYLETKFGETWQNWKLETPAFVPRPGTLGAKGVQGCCDRSFGKAFIADKSTWIWLCVFMVLLVLRKVL